MYELALLFAMSALLMFMWMAWPVVRHYNDNKKQRLDAVKRYNRVHRCRK
jgi:hypothetical protein